MGISGRQASLAMRHQDGISFPGLCTENGSCMEQFMNIKLAIICKAERCCMNGDLGN